MARHLKKAQSTLEYAMTVICVLAALLVMQHYIKRGAMGKLRESADSMGEQYDAHYINSQVSVNQTGSTGYRSQQVREGPVDGVRTTITTTNEQTTNLGNENLQAFPGGLYD